MSALIGRPISSTFLVVCALSLPLSCGRTAHDGPGGQQPFPSAGSPSDAQPDVAVGAASAAGSMSTSGTGGSGLVLAGTTSSIEPNGVERPCEQKDTPGEPCDAARCWGQRCGVGFDLSCKDGAWDSGDDGLAWELVCPVASESVYDIRDIKEGACCGELLPRNEVYTEPPSCSLCPDAAPADGDPCSLPGDCTAALIDCFYKCCCYGNLTWAQCDGKEWHVTTNCSAK